MRCGGAEHSQVGHTLIEAADEIAVESVKFLVTQNDDDEGFDPNFDYGKIEPINSPVKVFIDLVSHTSSLGRMRDEELTKSDPSLLKEFHGREPRPLEIVQAVRRLSPKSRDVRRLC